MKKFSFSLQKLLDYKEQVLEAERIVLADMNTLLAAMLAERDAMQRDKLQRVELLREKSAAGMAALEMETHKNYLTALDFSIKQKIRQITLQRQAIDKQMDVVKEAKMDISTMEKLKERKLEEYNYTAQKAEEQFIEEFVTTSKAMGQQAG